MATTVVTPRRKPRTNSNQLTRFLLGFKISFHPLTILALHLLIKLLAFNLSNFSCICHGFLLHFFLAVNSLSASKPSYSLPQQLWTMQVSAKTINCISNIAMKIPHSSLTNSFVFFGSCGDFSITRLDFSLVNKSNMASIWSINAAMRSEIWVMKQKWMS